MGLHQAHPTVPRFFSPILIPQKVAPFLTPRMPPIWGLPGGAQAETGI
jgi:hypothetical protein